MKIIKFTKKSPPNRMSLEEFAQEYELTLVVNERSDEDVRWMKNHSGDASRFYAYFQTFELIIGNGILTSVSGDGDTEQEAIADLARQISRGKAKLGIIYIDIPELYV